MSQMPVSPKSAMVLLCIAFSIGVIAGIANVIFRAMISIVHNVFFLGQFNLIYDANVHTVGSHWGLGVVLVPMVGGIGVVWLVKNFAPEAKGHGVPEVLDAIHYKGARIRPIVSVIKSLASALSIGSGGAVGREGPIIQIGSAFGSTVGQIMNLPAYQIVTLIAAGAGAGIASAFNAPIGGLAFGVELLLVSVTAVNISVVAVATITAAYVSRATLGLTPAFNIPVLTIPVHVITHLRQMLLFIPFGVAIGVLSTVFIHALYWIEDWFDALPTNAYLRHMIGMFGLGLIIAGFYHFSGHYYVEGVGYSTIIDILNGALTNSWFLLLLCGFKLLAMFLTLGSGASGGVFSPALYVGATFGAAYAFIFKALFPGLGIDPSLFTVAGMAAMISGTTGAVMTSIVILYEMTRDYNAILPIILAVVLAYLSRKHLSIPSIYTMKCLREGRPMHEGLQAAMLSALTAKDVMQPLQIQAPQTAAFDVTPEMPLIEVLRLFDNRPSMIALVKDQKRVVGSIQAKDILVLLSRNAHLMSLASTGK